MTKLSKAQAQILEEAKKDIDEARNLTCIEWIRKHGSLWRDDKLTDEEFIEEFKKRTFADGETHLEWWTKRYEDRKNGIAATHCNSKTLYKLEELGLIKIIFDSKGHGAYNIDKIEVLNY